VPCDTFRRPQEQHRQTPCARFTVPLGRHRPHILYSQNVSAPLFPEEGGHAGRIRQARRDYQEHQNEIHAKLIASMGERLVAHIKSLNAIKWDVLPAKPGINKSLPRPSTPTPAPPSPLPLPPTNVPLGSPRSAAPAPLTKRPSLFSNDRLKGMLSRSSTIQLTSMPAPAPAPPPVPAQAKRGGYKQVSALLSPPPLPVEKQRELPSSCPFMPRLRLRPRRNDGSRPLKRCAVMHRRHRLGIERMLEGRIAWSRVRCNVAEHAPPTPAKDAVARSRATGPEPSPECTSVAG
jgi:hypothetical protein